MPEVAKMAVSAALVTALALAVLAPPPRRGHRAHAAAVATTGVMLYLVAIAVGLTGHVMLGTLLVIPGVAALTLAGWLVRGNDGRGPGPDEDLPEPLDPIDWDEFDRLRDEWASPTRHLVLA